MDSYESRGSSDRRRSPDRYNRDNRDNRNRRRSRSPPNIDRYQPVRGEEKYRQRDRENGDRDRRRRSPQPLTNIDRYVPGQDATAPIPTNPMPNPMTLDTQVGFSFYAAWWRAEQSIKEAKEKQKNPDAGPRIKGDKESKEYQARERELIQAAYDEYKEKLQAQMARTFVQQHRADEWFKERYEEGPREALRQTLMQFRLNAYSKWHSDLQAGVFDEFTLEGIPKSDSNGAGGIVEKEEGEAVASNEVLAVGDLLPMRGGDIRDEAALEPTLLIKTIAPTVSRAKLEDFCREHLGDDFKWLSLSDPNPVKKYHRIGWVMLNAPPVKMEVDERENGRDDAEDGEEVAGDGEERSAVSEFTTRCLGELNGKTIKDEERGDFTCHVGIHEPQAAPRKKALWDLFSSSERIDRDLQLAIRLASRLDLDLNGPQASSLHDGSIDAEPKLDYSGVEKIMEHVENIQGKGWLQPPATTSTKKPQDVDEMEDEEGAIDEDEEGALDDEDEVDDEALLVKKKQLDLLVEYLRRVHNFCLFCVFECDSVHELSRKCPGGHLRRPRASLTSSAKTAAKASAEGKPFPFKKDGQTAENEGDSPVDERKFNLKPNSKTFQQLTKAFNWVRTYEDKLIQILDPESVDLAKIGGKQFNEGLDELLKNYRRQEDESKWRCKVPDCSKLFKGESFWRKHIEKRHEEFYHKLSQDVHLVNSYVLDPAHIAPSRSDANSNGHFPLNNQGTTGTPRGFNLPGAGFGLPPGLGNGAMNPMQIASLMAAQGFPNQWGLPGVSDGDHGAGPRRTVQRNNSRMNPYDRNGNKDGRNQRWGNSGRLSPPRGTGGIGRGGVGMGVGLGGMNMGLMNPRYQEGGAGPREATMGRSIKNYEDLDAAGTNTSAAQLDY